VGWGLPGGCLGVPRDPSLETPRQPLTNPLSGETKIILNEYLKWRSPA